MTTSLAVRTRPQQSAPLTAIGAVPLVRVRRPPQFEPPYDDELIPPGGGHPFPDPDPHPFPDAGPDARPGSGPGSGGVPEAGTGPADWAEPASGAAHGARPADDPAAARSAPAAGGVPPRSGTGRHAAHRYVGLCLEVLEGFRPVGHLRRLTAPSAFDSVASQLARPVARAGHRPPDETLAGRRPGPAASAAHRGRGIPAVAAPGTAGGQGRPATGTSGRPAAAPGRPATGMPARPTAGAPGRPAQGTSGPAQGTSGRPAQGVPARPSQGSTGRPGIPGRPAGGMGWQAAGSAGRPAAGGQPAGTDRIRLRRLRLAEPRDGAVEVVAVLGRSGRFWALALRLEYRDEAWLCTHVEVV